MHFRSAYRFARLKLKSRRHRGTAVVELGAILPVFVLLLLGTIETCNMIFLQQSLKIAAYEGARITIVPATDLTDVENAVSGLLAARRVNGATVSITPSNFQNAPYGSFIRVDVTASCNSNTTFALRFYGSKALTGTVEMMKEF
jgi:Flp pilus assembly protein TadG